jgi:phospholipid/cholesterol/gamma-HCH transport system ATP-binding protein
MKNDVVIAVRGLRTQFGDTVIHDNLDLAVRRGEVLGVVGGSGTGKSVLLRTIIGLNRPRAGTIEMLGEDTAAISTVTQRRCGVLFQNAALFSSLTVAENIQVPMREHLRLPQQLLDELAALKIAMVGLPPDAGPKFPAELSGGCASAPGWPAPWRSIQRYCFLMNRRRGWIRSAPPPSTR